MATITKALFTLPDGTQTKFSLAKDGEYTIGTSEKCIITLDDDTLDEKHAKLAPDETNDERWFLQTISDGAITLLEDGAEAMIGKTALNFTIIVEDDEEEEEDDEDDDEEDFDEDEDEDEDELEHVAPVIGKVDDLHNEKQLKKLQEAQQMRELKNAATLIVVLGLLSFAAGVAWRLLRLPSL